MGGQEGAEAADAGSFVGVVVDKPGVNAQDTLSEEGGLEFGGQEFLKLVGLDAEDVGLEAAVDFDAVVDHLARGAAGYVGLDVEDALFVDGQGDEGGVVGPVGVGAFAGVEGEDLGDGFGRPVIEPVVFSEVGFGPFAEVGVEGRVLFFAFEGGPAALGSEAHEGVEVFDVGPEDGGAFVHGGFALFCRRRGRLVGDQGELSGFGVQGWRYQEMGRLLGWAEKRGQDLFPGTALRVLRRNES